MSQRTKLISLGVLLLVLVIVAYHQLWPKSQAPNKNAPPPSASSAPAATPAPAPAGAGAEAKPADMAQDSGPSAADLRELADWFDLLNPKAGGIQKGRVPVFGMGSKSMPDEDATSQQQEPEQISSMGEPGRLDGIIKVGDSPGQALFDGQLYQVGDRVRGTTFTIVAVDDDSVTLKSGDHVIQRFWHD